PGVRPVLRAVCIAPLVPALPAVRPAAAQQPLEVTILPGGQPWSIGGRGGSPCEPYCTMRLPRDKYEVVVGENKATLLLQAPTEITYDPGNPRLRKIAGWTAIGGVGVGGVLVGIGAYALF